METEHRLSKLEEKVSGLDKDLGVFSEVIKRFDCSINKLTTSLDKFDNAVTDLKSNMLQLGNQVECNNKDIEHLKDEVEKIDEKGKVDWISLVTGKLIPVLIGGGVVYLILEIVSK